MKLKHLFCCGAAIGLVATGANAATIKLIDQGGVAGSPAELGFKIAAAYWGSILTNNVTINLGVGFAPLPTNVIGSTGSTRNDLRVSTWENLVNTSKSNSLLDRSIVLPTLNAQGGATFITNGTDASGNDDTSVKGVDLGTTVSSKVLYENTSVIKAIGGTATYAASNAQKLDGNVTFSSTFAFDFDPTNGISAGTFDFIGVAIHEIGHALGFVSGVDFLDQYGKPNGPGAGALGYSLNDTSIYSALDMFRYSKDPTNLVLGNAPVLDLSVGTASYFSVNGGTTALFGNTFSTGAYNGDGSQASHWKDTPGCTAPQLGIMDPTFCYGQMGEVTALDIAAFDAIGWNTSVDALGTPGYRTSTATIYRTLLSAVPEPTTWAMMLTGFAMMGGALRTRRAKTKIRVAFQG